MVRESYEEVHNKKRALFCSGSKLWEFVITTGVPFAIPWIKDIGDQYMHIAIKWILISTLCVVDLVLIYKLNKDRDLEKTEVLSSTITRDAYSNAYELNEKKRDYLKSRSYDENFSIPANTIPYNVHDYIGEICKNFGATIAKITGIAKEYTSVSFIYHYIYDNASSEDRKWRWIIGKESNSRISLDEFTSRRNTLYHYMLSDPRGMKLNFVFSNDKKILHHLGHYHLSVRDEDHNKNGSVFAVRVTFGNNPKSFAEGIMIVSTYGKKFVQRSNADFSERQLKNLIIEEIFPFYQRLLETELGVLYLRHLSENQSKDENVKKER